MNIRQIAREAGVSYMTVSRVLNGHPSVKEDTRSLVRSVMEANHYVPLHAATQIGRKTSRVVGLVLPKLEYGFYDALVNRFHEVALARGLEPEVHFSQMDAAREGQALRALESRRALGVLVSGVHVDNFPLLKQHTHIRQMVFLGVPRKAHGANPLWQFAGYDEGAMARILLEHLRLKGHRRVLYVSSRMDLLKRAGAETGRRLGYLAWCRKHKMDPGPVMVLDNDRYDEVGDPGVLMRHVEKDRVTVAFCDNDFAALKIYRGAALAGLAVPRDLSVVGIDDLFMGRYLSPALTTVGLPYEETVTPILDRFMGHHPEPLRMALEPPLRLRESVRDLVESGRARGPAPTSPIDPPSDT